MAQVSWVVFCIHLVFLTIIIKETWNFHYAQTVPQHINWNLCFQSKCCIRNACTYHIDTGFSIPVSECPKYCQLCVKLRIRTGSSNVPGSMQMFLSFGPYEPVGLLVPPYLWWVGLPSGAYYIQKIITISFRVYSKIMSSSANSCFLFEK